MSRLPGQIWMILMAAGVLSLIASWVIGYAYRRALVRHMGGKTPGVSEAAGRSEEIDDRRVAGALAGRYPTGSDNRAAQRRLTWYILAVTALLAVSAAALQWRLLFDVELTPGGCWSNPPPTSGWRCPPWPWPGGGGAGPCLPLSRFITSCSWHSG